ncbi:hypothetical protein [Streptomyces sp. NBC_01304]|uniref:hypothetical protein n=1 Tax=Streptomyces sp. NBC_01304 TaxID=2903818 RepID=UPI002E0F680B|nr:hypothetical protein OG430_15320 [Streptomyces sp. NBC_01304]
MARPRGTRSALLITASVVVLAAVAGAVGWWLSSGDGAEDPHSAAAPGIPATLCETTIPSRALKQLVDSPAHDFSMRNLTGTYGGLTDPLGQGSGRTDEAICVITIDGEAVQLAVTLQDQDISRASITDRVQDKGSALAWGPAKGYINPGTTTIARLSLACVLPKGAASERHRFVDVSVTGPRLRPDDARHRQAMADLTADITRYAIRQTARCTNIDAPPAGRPTVGERNN